MGSQPVYFRMLDIGADKTSPVFGLPQEVNPSLGLRGSRLLLARPELLRDYLYHQMRGARGETDELPEMAGEGTAPAAAPEGEALALLHEIRDELHTLRQRMEAAS